jgi:SAM-dependent methyltransferase
MNIKENWHKFYQGYIGTSNYFYISSQIYGLYMGIKLITEKYVFGKVLDLGCGEMTYKELLKPKSKEYISLDKYACHPDIDYVADINKLPFEDNSFDVIFCSQVLEHVPRPWISIKEISRVLKPGGNLILTVPHLTYLHGEPEDYYRYTKYGIKELGKVAGLEQKEMISTGGFLSFIFTPFSIFILSISVNIKFLSNFVFFINKYFVILLDHLDKIFDKNKIYCYNYVSVFSKKNDPK